MVIFVLNWHLLRAEDIVSRFAYGAQSLSVPRPPGPGENLGNDEEYDEDRYHCIVGKKWDHRILDPMIFSGKIRKNRKS